jgi:hypothetical protein
MCVEKVIKGDVKEDYYKNVNKAGFLEWLRKLFIHLASLSGQYIIVT